MHTRYRRAIAVVAIASLSFAHSLSLAQKAQPKLPTIELKIGKEKVVAEVADTEQSRMTGLMLREKLGANEGMLFVFPQLGYHGMWMRNTLIPLSVAFIDESGSIVNIEEMQPKTEDNHEARAPVRYALEMQGGWFTQKNIKAGEKVLGVDKAPKPR